ncbi:MAG: ATP-binding cassette domain-containing protein [Bacteroidetes bacterium]|nr:ATP-binding cassette domain-containing protein [Bacteroidota bacterium]MQY80299.1 ATP-binding cassette domain-containing protein [Bacteroidota bacterium]
MIHLDNVSKIFGSPLKQVEALKNIDLHVNKGEFIIIRGPSGSGKTTLLLSIGGMLQPSSGVVNVENKDIYLLNEFERTKFRAYNIGFVFQMFYLIPYLNVLENIMLAAGLGSNGTRQRKASELADQLGISDRILHKPSELSAGERQRVALARALIHQPKIILADEPTGNLDPDNSREVIRILKEYHQTGGTVVFVTHGKDADQFADRIFNLSKGEIVQ